MIYDNSSPEKPKRAFTKLDTRREVLDGLSVLGVKIDEDANDCRGVERLITTEDSSIPCYIIPTNEELMIARDTYALYQEMM